MQANFFMMVLVGLLITSSCKKSEHKIDLNDDLLVKKIITVIAESKGSNQFVSTEVLFFDYDGSNRLLKVEKKIIHQREDRTDTLHSGHDEFIYNQDGKLSRRNRFGYSNSYYPESIYLQSYEELTYNHTGLLPVKTSSYVRHWDQVREQFVFRQSGYFEYIYNNSKQLTEKINYFQRFNGSDEAGAPILRTVYHYSPAGNIVASDIYSMAEAYGPVGNVVVKCEYSHAAEGHNPLFFGSEYAPDYTSGTVALASNPAPLVREKITSTYQSGLPDLLQTRDFTTETDRSGYPVRSIEIYEKETYTRLPETERPTLLTERGKRDSRFEYIKKIK